MGGLINQSLIDNGLIKTFHNQDLLKLKNDGKFLLTGMFELYFDDKRVDSICALSLNDLAVRTGVAFYPDDPFVIAEVKKGINRVDSINCGKGSNNPAFQYEFSDFEFSAEKQLSYFGSITIYFANKRGEDGYKKYERTQPSIKKIIFKDDEKLLHEINKKFEINNNKNILSNIKIIKD